MSVPQWKQTASQLDAYNEAVKLRHIVTEMIMRDFGLKLPERQYEIHIGQQLRNRYPELADLFNKFDKIQDETTGQELLTQYPKWMIENRRQKLDEYTADLIKWIGRANEIKCDTEEEYKDRIHKTDEAIGALENVKQEVNFVEEFFAVDLNNYMNFADQFDKTQHYLYSWKKSTVRDYDEFLHPEKKAERLAKKKRKPYRHP